MIAASSPRLPRPSPYNHCMTGKSTQQGSKGSTAGKPADAPAAAVPAAPAAEAPWTTRRLLKWMQEHFASRQVDSPRIVAEMLLAHVLTTDRMHLYMEADRPASRQELDALRPLVVQAGKHHPVQYLVGHDRFFGRDFVVSPATLIPRPCTETLVEAALAWHRLHPDHAQPLIADIGTGSGCIGISLAAQIRDSRIVATDIRQDALDLARQNAQKHKTLDRMEFRLGPGLTPLAEAGPPGLRFDMIASNPPYIPDHEWADVPPNVKDYEPETALRGGTDGLDVIRPLIAAAGPLLKPRGLLAVEIADCQRDQVVDLARQAGHYENIDVLKDHEGLWRVLTAERRAE